VEGALMSIKEKTMFLFIQLYGKSLGHAELKGSTPALGG
jgi:hypothetical protein